MIDFANITFRHHWKNRIFTTINILGLSIGLACFIGITSYTRSELSYDKHHTDAENIFRVKLKGQMSGTAFEAAVTGAPVAELLFTDLPEVILFTRLIQLPRSVLFVHNESKIYQEGILYSDSSFFKMFTFNLSGDSENALKEPYSLVMLESVAKKYFGNENPIGKIIKWDNKIDYTVKAVIKEPLQNSHLGFEVLVSRSSLYSHPSYESIYNNMFAFTNIAYIKCSHHDIKELNRKINEVFQLHAGESMKESGSVLTIELQPIRDIHLRSNITHEIKQNGSITTVYIFIAVSFLILTISSINYVNLSIATSSNRRFDVAVKKVFGAGTKSLFFSFLGESILFVLISSIIAYFILDLISPIFDPLTNHVFSSLLLDKSTFLLLAVSVLIIGIAAGSYPALYLTSLNPMETLRGKFSAGKEKLYFRNTMITIQFVISIFLICSTLLIRKQIDFINSKDLGFTKDSVLVLSLRNSSMVGSYTTLRDELQKIPGVVGISASSSYIGSFNQRRGFYIDGLSRKEMMMILNFQCEENLLPLLDIEITEGRNFFPDSQNDVNKIIVNQSLLHEFGIDNPIGKAFRLPGSGEESADTRLEIIGVCNDFQFASLHEPVKPLIIWKDPSLRRYVYVKIHASDQSVILASLSKKWGEIFPDYPFEYFYLSERLKSLYGAEENTSRVFTIFTFIALAISCLGVFGLAAYTTQNRTKEIGIRKVLGAQTKEIMGLISKDFLSITVIASVVSIPASWYFINQWLQEFSFRTPIRFYVFVIGPLIALVVALITINVVAYHAAQRNPVDAIRQE